MFTGERLNTKSTLNGVILGDDNDLTDDDCEVSPQRLPLRLSPPQSTRRPKQKSHRNTKEESFKSPTRVKIWLRKVEKKVRLSPVNESIKNS